jgi:tetratricopeptide (TPR) repeat protein
MSNLALLYQNQERYAEAEALGLQSLALARRLLGEEHPGTLASMGNLAMVYQARGNFAAAEPLMLQTLEIVKRVLGEEHPSTLATLTNIGTLYNSMTRFEEAAAMFEVSLPIKRRVLGMQHPWTGNAMKGLVTAYLGLGRAEDALPLQRELLGLQSAAADRASASAEVLNGAAWTMLTIENESLRDPERALGFAKRACALANEARSDQLWAYLDTLALAQHKTGDTKTAIETQERAIALMPEGADPEMAERLAEYEAALKDR